jgi:hypothetical protein
MEVSKRNLSAILHDLANSHYFRIWALLWFICMVAWFVGLGIMSDKSRHNAEYPWMNSYMELENSLAFPSFYFMLGEPTALQPAASCYWGGDNTVVMHSSLCSCPGPGCNLPMSQCFQINPPSNVRSTIVPAGLDDGIYSNGGNSSWIQCSFTASSANNFALMRFDLPNVNRNGVNSWASVWFGPNTNTWILLTESLIDNVPYWDRDMLYHGDWQPNQNGTLTYNVRVLLDTNLLKKSYGWNYYTGWQCVSDLGGLAFMLVIFHRLIMVAIGFLLENDSRFLGGTDAVLHDESVPIVRGH